MDLRYPIGGFEWKGEIDAARRGEYIREIAATPARLRQAVAGWTDSQLDLPYRPGGWTVRQVVHHVADSHLNNYMRVRLALTEDNPTIRPYDEARWAELADARSEPVEVSLRLLESLHERWVRLLESLPEEAFARTYLHPESGPATLDKNLALYAWHGAHHIAHITGLREREAGHFR